MLDRWTALTLALVLTGCAESSDPRDVMTSSYERMTVTLAGLTSEDDVNAAAAALRKGIERIRQAGAELESVDTQPGPAGAEQYLALFEAMRRFHEEWERVMADDRLGPVLRREVGTAVAPRTPGG